MTRPSMSVITLLHLSYQDLLSQLLLKAVNIITVTFDFSIYTNYLCQGTLVIGCCNLMHKKKVPKKKEFVILGH